MIGVSYTGHDGRKASFGVQGAEDAASRMAGLTGKTLRETVSDAQGLLRMARKPAPQQQPQPPAQRRERVMPGGSVVRAPDGAICLRGEELNPLVPGIKVFGAKNGDKGFFSLDEIDPPLHGAVVGKNVGDDSQSLDADGQKKDAPDGAAWAMRVQTDERADKDNATGLITVYKYFRRIYFSASGRAVGCSEEWREVAFSFLPGAGAEATWCVRPTFNNGVLSALYFGTNASLSEDNFESAEGVTEVETCQCPNA